MTSLKKKNNKKKKDFSDLPTLIFLDMSLETDILFFLALAQQKQFTNTVISVVIGLPGVVLN